MTILFTLLLIFLATKAEAAVTRYVDGNISPASCATYSIANRNCSGSDGTAHKTINAGKAVMSGGDITEVRAGTYNESLFIQGPDGTAGAYTTIRRYQNETVVINGNGSTSFDALIHFGYPGDPVQYFQLEGFILDGSNLTMNIAAPGIVIQSWGQNTKVSNSVVRNCPQSCVQTIGGGFNQFINNEVHTNGLSGYPQSNAYYIQDGNNLVENNIIHNIKGIGIRFWHNTGAPGPNNIARFNTIYNYNQSGTNACAISIGDDNNIINHNIVYDVQSNGCGLDTRGENPSDLTMIYNNTFYNAAASGNYILRLHSTTTRTTIKNNIFVPGAGSNILNDATGTLFSNNLCQSGGCGTGNINNQNPSFTNPAAGNFTLQTGSPAINAGTASISTLPLINIPACGTPPGCYFGATPDMGALETGAPAAVVVTITTPTANPTFTTSNSGLDLAGTVK